MKKYSLYDMLIYRLDKLLRSPFKVQLASLGLFTLIVTVTGTALAILTMRLTMQFRGYGDAFWWTWLRVTDPGYLSLDEGFWLRIVSTIVLMSGWVVFGILISIISTAIQERLALLRKGANRVLATKHTIILGWDSTIFSVIDQLCADDEGISNEVIVLADRDRDEMEDDIKKYCQQNRSRKTICRSGSITSVADIERLNISSSRQIIVLGYDDSSREQSMPTIPVLKAIMRDELKKEDQRKTPDIHVVKAVIACCLAISRSRDNSENIKIPIVAAIRSKELKNLSDPAIFKDICEGVHVEAVDTLDILCRIIAQCAIQRNLSLVYHELLSYWGDRKKEIKGKVSAGSGDVYCVPVEECYPDGKTVFEDCLFGFPKAIPIGYQVTKGNKLTTIINPRPESDESSYQLDENDKFIIIADKRKNTKWEGKNAQKRKNSNNRGQSKSKQQPCEMKPLHMVVLGLGVKARLTIKYLLGYLPGKSKIFTNEKMDDFKDPRVKTIPLPEIASIINSDTLKELDQADTVILVDDDNNPDRHDSRILSYMIAIKARSIRAGHFPEIIVGEFLDPRNREIAEKLKIKEVIISSELVSNYMVQLAFENERADVFKELLDKEGNEIYVRPASNYLGSNNSNLSFENIMYKARSFHEIAIGYITPENRVELCPSNREDDLLTKDHKVVVIAEE